MLLALCCALTLHAQEAIVPGDILVMLAPGASAQQVADDLQQVNGRDTHLRVVKEVSAPMRAWLLHYDAPAIPQHVMVCAVRGHKAVMLAQDNHRVKERAVPNDADYAQQWHHQNIDSEAAWDITTGGLTATGDTIVVCIVENADLPHPDLIGNAWYNRGEIPGNGVDDDGNGYVDDFRGWNPSGDNDNVYGGSHGTRVAGMIGAKGDNGQQVAGANWNVKMMPVTYANTDEANVVESYTYPLVMRRLYNSSGGSSGAFVVATNASWGVDGGQPQNAPLWCAMYDTLGTAGILNCGATANNAVNVDVVGDLPTACASDFMISVTATNINDMRTGAAWGATTIDVGAPGTDVVTTAMGGGITTTTGTSFASPLTAGVIGLLYSVPCPGLMAVVHSDPSEGALRIRQALFNGVEQVGNLPGNTVTGGRINAFNSLQWLLDDCSDCPVAYNLTASSAAIGEATLAWSGTAETYEVRYRAVGDPTWTTIEGISGHSVDVTGVPACGSYEFQVAPVCEGTPGDHSASYAWTTEGCCTAPLSITATAQDNSSATVQWSTVLAAGTYALRFREQGTTDWTVVDALTGTSTTLTGLQPCTDQEVEMSSSCGGITADWSAPVLLHIPGCGQCVEGDFCESEGGSAASEWIDRVAIGTIDNTSGSDDGYAYQDGYTTTLEIGQPHSISLTPGFSSFSYDEYFTVWMDLDHDGGFSAPDELVYDPGSASEDVVEGPLIVPADAEEGPVRMRVVMSYQDAVNTGCSPYDYGETEDYCVTLVAGNVGVRDLSSEADVLVFPDPADASITFVALAMATDVLVLDGAGRQVARRAMVNGRAVIDTGGWSEGLYVYRILRKDAGAVRGRFIVAH